MVKSQNSEIFLSEHLRGENRYGGVVVTPAAGLEPCFATGVVEEGLPIPAVLRCHLRQEEAACRPALEQNPIPTDDYLVKIDALEGSESGDLDVRVVHLVCLQRVKTRVLEGGGDGVVADCSPQRRDANHMTDTTSESAIDLESHKDAARFEEFWVVRLGRGKGSAVQLAQNRLACEHEQKAGPVTVDGVLGGTDIHHYQDGILTP